MIPLPPSPTINQFPWEDWMDDYPYEEDVPFEEDEEFHYEIPVEEEEDEEDTI